MSEMKEIESVRQFLKSKIKELDNLIVRAEKSLKKAPEGSLVLSRSNGTVQYHNKTESTQKKGKYISVKNRDLAIALAQKDYDLRFVKAITEQKNRIYRAMTLLPDVEPTEIYSQLSEARKELVKPYVLTDEQYVEQWLNVKYAGKEFAPDTPMLMTERGERVRSKTEKILADKFYTMGIPYRYEYPLKLNGYGIVYPDFTLLNVSKRKEYYLEHFGMMDTPEYCQKVILKLENYARNEIYPGKNLLITFETFRNPLNMNTVEQMLKEFIL